jgi:hypothetical protein
MKLVQGLAASLTLTAMGWAHPVGAHQSFAAEFIEGSSGEIEGVVTRVLFNNPHVRYRLEATVADGSAVEWELQLTSVTNLRNQEWFRDTVKVGDTIWAQGEVARDGSNKL